MSSDNSKLFVTAVGAAVAGAALGVTMVKLMDRKSNYVSEVSAVSGDRPVKRSFIYEDPGAEPITRRDSNTTLFPHNHEEKMRRRIAARAAVEEDNLTPRRSVTVRVPATSANVGPGCKCLTVLVPSPMFRVQKEVERFSCSTRVVFHRRLHWSSRRFVVGSHCGTS
jgi:hypothetical protein